MAQDKERSAEELAAIDRASRAGEDDGKAGDFDSEGKRGSDTPDQKAAYDASYDKSKK